MTWQFAKLTKQASQSRQEINLGQELTSMAFLLKLTKSNNTWQDLNSIKLNLNNTQEILIKQLCLIYSNSQL